MEIPKKHKMTKQEQRQEWCEHIPNLHNGSYRRVYVKAITKQSMRSAVNSKCLDCSNWQSTEVRNCTVVTCPLYEYRPYQDGSDDLLESILASGEVILDGSGEKKQEGVING